MKPSDIVFYDCGGGERPAQANPYGIQLRDVMAGSDGGAIARCKAASLVRKTGSRYQTRPAVARFAFVFYDRSGVEGRATGSTGESKRHLGCERRPRLANAGSRYQALPPVANLIHNALSDIAQPLPVIQLYGSDIGRTRLRPVRPSFVVGAVVRGHGVDHDKRGQAGVGSAWSDVAPTSLNVLKFPNRRRLAATTSFGEYLSAINDHVALHVQQIERESIHAVGIPVSKLRKTACVPDAFTHAD